MQAPAAPSEESPSGHARRAPRQERAQQTLELLQAAAVRVLERAGLEGLTTTAVAEEAGVSVGSVYRYFHDRDALLLEIAEREMHRSASEVAAAVARARAKGLPGAEAAVRALFASVSGRHRARRTLIDVAANAGRSDILLGALGRIEPLLTSEPESRMSTTSAFVLGAAVVGVLRASLWRERDPSRDTALHAELVRLVRSYRRACAEPGEPSSIHRRTR